MGLVEFQRNRGARVREISLAEAIEITQVRRLLEGYEAAQAARRVTQQETKDLRQIVKNMHAAVAAADPLRYSDLNAELHGTIRDIGATRRVHACCARYEIRRFAIPSRCRWCRDGPASSLPSMRPSWVAVTSKDPDAAEQAMHRHLDSVLEAFQALAAGSRS